MDEQDRCASCQSHERLSAEYVERVSLEYAKLGLRGVTMVAASGDSGAPGRTNELCEDTEQPVRAAFPAGGPFVTAVGGTYVVASNGTVDWETPLCQQEGCATGVERG